MKKWMNEWLMQKNFNVCCGVKEWCVRQQLWRWTQREKQPVWRPGCILQGTDWNVTHSMACATVTSFGSFSAGGAEAVCRCSLPASRTTLNRDYDHIMQMTVPSVQSSLMLACSLFVFWLLWVLEATESVTVQPCVDKAEGDRNPCSDKYTGIHYIVSGAVCWLTMKWAFRGELKQPASKSLELEMFTGWDLPFCRFWLHLDTHTLVHFGSGFSVMDFSCC